MNQGIARQEVYKQEMDYKVMAATLSLQYYPQHEFLNRWVLAHHIALEVGSTLHEGGWSCCCRHGVAGAKVVFDAPDHMVVVPEHLDVVVHAGHTFVVVVLNREHATAQGVEYQQVVDGEGRENVCALSYYCWNFLERLDPGYPLSQCDPPLLEDDPPKPVQLGRGEDMPHMGYR